MTPGSRPTSSLPSKTHGKAVAAARQQRGAGRLHARPYRSAHRFSRRAGRLKGSEVRNITAVGDRLYDAIIRYTKLDDNWFELRSRWTRFDRRHAGGSFSVRNIPDTPPWLSSTGPSDDGLDTPHWDGLRAGKLMLQRCLTAPPGCGRRGRSARPAIRSDLGWESRRSRRHPCIPGRGPGSRSRRRAPATCPTWLSWSSCPRRRAPRDGRARTRGRCDAADRRTRCAARSSSHPTMRTGRLVRWHLVGGP